MSLNDKAADDAGWFKDPDLIPHGRQKRPKMAAGGRKLSRKQSELVSLDNVMHGPGQLSGGYIYCGYYSGKVDESRTPWLFVDDGGSDHKAIVPVKYISDEREGCSGDVNLAAGSSPRFVVYVAELYRARDIVVGTDGRISWGKDAGTVVVADGDGKWLVAKKDDDWRSDGRLVIVARAS